MNIKIFTNKKYLASRYKMSNETIERFNAEVMPNLMNRLAMDSRIGSIQIYTNESNNSSIGFSSKLIQTVVDTDNIDSYAELIDLCTAVDKDEVIVIYNPLFPFLSLDKIHLAYQQIISGKFESAFGVDNYYARVVNDQNLELMDVGIFSIFKSKSFKNTRRRIHQPLLPVKLSAIELISLREKDDYELYGLVVNSGLMQ
jgi:hypothetical protein